jgi:hypothetical protein
VDSTPGAREMGRNRMQVGQSHADLGFCSGAVDGNRTRIVGLGIATPD